MKPWIPFALTIAVAVPTHVVTRDLLFAAAPADATLPSEPRTAELAARIAGLEEANAKLEERVAAALAAPSAPATEDAPEAGPEDVERALDAWLAARGLDRSALEGAPAGDPAAPTGGGGELAQRVAELSIDELLAFMAENGGFDENSDLVFEELRRTGRIGEYVAALEAQVEANPEDADLRVSLGMAYLQELFGLSASPEAGVLATKADEAFDAALGLDETNWGARFLKAVSLSNWPAFMGRTNEAIGHFEILVAQQEGIPAEPSFSETWLFLGNMYDQSGRRDEALDAWRRGLERFPDDAALREQLDLAEGDGD